MLFSPEPGWYPDPSGSIRQRYHDGRSWTTDFREAPVREPVAIVEGPNHGLHLALTILTCGLWSIVWVFIAANDRKTIRYV